MTRGMVTIATGDKHYYEIAANLLLSYRFFQKNAGGGTHRLQLLLRNIMSIPNYLMM